MKRTRISRYSPRKVAQLNAEAPIRIALCRRAGGAPSLRLVQVYSNGDKLEFTKVECVGGTCENCHEPQAGLEPHEQVTRAQGGCLSLENTVMVCRKCHRLLQHSEPMWSKGDNGNGRKPLHPLVEDNHARRPNQQGGMSPLRIGDNFPE